MTLGESLRSRRSWRLRLPLPSPGRLGRYLIGAIFLAPALFMLGVWMVYPAVYTIIRSFFGQTGFIGTWVGIDNYKTLFTTSDARDGDQEQRASGSRSCRRSSPRSA